MIIILTCSIFSTAGRYHKENNQPNGDKITQRLTSSACAVVACDGAGSMGQGGIAAELISNLLANKLAHEFDLLYFSDPESTKTQIIRSVEKCLIEVAHDKNIAPSELACTIVAAAMDIEGRCICCHLGDGIIFRHKEGMAQWDIVSSPRNGLVNNTTFLTMNCDLHFNLQYYRWKELDIDQILLLTDGASKYFFPQKNDTAEFRFSENTFDELRNNLISFFPNDDFSFGIITRKMK